MNNYYFTFGQSHKLIDGYPMKDHWVRVQANNYFEARTLFIDRFSSIQMEKPDKWAFQYEENNFKPEYFSNGEYELIIK